MDYRQERPHVAHCEAQRMLCLARCQIVVPLPRFHQIPIVNHIDIRFEIGVDQNHGGQIQKVNDEGNGQHVHREQYEQHKEKATTASGHGGGDGDGLLNIYLVGLQANQEHSEA